jgi:hypothetical protein
LLNGQRIPSVNECTGTLSKDGLIRNFWRPLGFKKADRVSREAREQGSSLAEVMERYRKTGKTGPISAYNKACVQNWTKWYDESDLEIKSDSYIEPHLVNTIEGYHGSPDVILHRDWHPVLGDDKSKKRFSDYALLMNEHAYAMCDSYEDLVTHEIKKLPWLPPVQEIWFWVYDPDTGELFPESTAFDPLVYADFLRCKAMVGVNKRAEDFFKAHAQLLPSQQAKQCKESV